MSAGGRAPGEAPGRVGGTGESPVLSLPPGWEPVIGLEIHVQLRTLTKLFCGSSSEFGAQPNTHVCPVCLGLPGALPVTNARAVQLAVRAALGLGCTVHQTSVFARKNYFYPDLPKGYQITQYDRPLATGGWLEGTGEARADEATGGPPGRVRIRRIHLEEDAGKSLHDRFAGKTAIDLNRAGVPLIEIVTEPDLRSPAHARAFLTRLKQTIEYLDVSDCDMEKGSLRVDANVSVRPLGRPGLGTKTEVKNMNSFSNVERALAYEIRRQVGELAAGRAVSQETLLWDAARGESRSMRSKEESHDYRYFPEPDLPPLVLRPDEIESIRAALPELPAARRERFVRDYRLPAYDADVLTSTRDIADYYERAARGADAKSVANWVMTEVLALANRLRCSIARVPVAPGQLRELLALVAAGTLSTGMARRVFERVAETGRSPGDIVREEGLAQVIDEDRLEGWVADVVEAHPVEVERYRAGDARLLGFLIGELMKASGGAADPRRARELLMAHLERDRP